MLIRGSLAIAACSKYFTQAVDTQSPGLGVVRRAEDLLGPGSGSLSGSASISSSAEHLVIESLQVAPRTHTQAGIVTFQVDLPNPPHLMDELPAQSRPLIHM